MPFRFFPAAQQQRVSLSDVGVERRASSSSRHVSGNSAKRVSAVWAALNLRASLISTFPVDVLRRVPGSKLLRTVETPKVLREPDTYGPGQPMSILEWMYSTQQDLDMYGNAVGIIVERDGAKLPRTIRLVSAKDVSITGKGSQIESYRIGTKTYAPDQIWHERQYTVAGSPLGLSPIAYAAMPINSHLSSAEFALAWFDRSNAPSVILKYTAGDLTDEDAQITKRRATASLHNGEPAVVGKNWDVALESSRAKDAQFIEVAGASNVDIARFFSVPASLIDAAVSGQSVTYQNLTESNLAFLQHFLDPAITRRETSLSRLVAPGTFVKLNRDSLLRMAPKERRSLLIEEVKAGLKTVDEARELENLEPLPKGEGS